MGKNSGVGSALGLGAGLGIGVAGGTGGGVFVCNTENQSTTYCQFLQAFSILKMLLWIFVLIAIVVYLCYWYFGVKRKKGGSAK